MSFRFRVLALTLLIAVTATVATAWLTLHQASGQLTDSVTAANRDVLRVTDELGRYGREHAGWSGVSATVTAISRRTGLRVRVETVSGDLVADSDLLAGRPARAVVGPATLADPRPTLRLADRAGQGQTLTTVWSSFTSYVRESGYARCVQAAGGAVLATTGPAGVPEYHPTGGGSAAEHRCRSSADRAAPSTAEAKDFKRALRACLRDATTAFASCLNRWFAAHVGRYAPDSVRVYVGARGQTDPAIGAGPTALVAGIVALAAVAAAVLLSRRVLRPVRALTAAARQLGDGAGAGPVPVSGRDEIAQLGRAFNRMAASLAASEERQRQQIADVAHELRTPLANLRGYLEALADGVLPPSPELFASLHDEALLQQRIVDDLQVLALAESGALSYHREPVDLGEVAAACRTAHSGNAEAAGVTLAVERHGPAVVSGDPERLRQAVGNLIRNALAATPAGGRIVLAVAAGDGRARLDVTDTGSGIDPADLPHLFDRFWRADPARGGGRSGLGLTIARQLVTDHGGSLTAVSTPGSGSTFTVALPLI
ncbi:HAMP domain-containing sensor histidine kinase [Actinocatenispora sera]|uniref:sensor histidine kinase n=1 Tax=Actinocatenispora sera TaxID=390989 RepID=UPI0033DF7898